MMLRNAVLPFERKRQKAGQRKRKKEIFMAGVYLSNNLDVGPNKIVNCRPL